MTLPRDDSGRGGGGGGGGGCRGSIWQRSDRAPRQFSSLPNQSHLIGLLKTYPRQIGPLRNYTHFSAPFIMSEITCNSKTIAFTEFCIKYVIQLLFGQL